MARRLPGERYELRDGVEDAAVTDELHYLAQRTDATKLVERVLIVDHRPVDRRHNAKIDRPRIAASR